jgi:MYND finger
MNSSNSNNNSNNSGGGDLKNIKTIVKYAKLVHTKAHGRGFIATEDIKTGKNGLNAFLCNTMNRNEYVTCVGSELLVEVPFYHVVHSNFISSHCSYCLISKEEKGHLFKCPQCQSISYCSTECQVKPHSSYQV